MGPKSQVSGCFITGDASNMSVVCNAGAMSVTESFASVILELNKL